MSLSNKIRFGLLAYLIVLVTMFTVTRAQKVSTGQCTQSSFTEVDDIIARMSETSASNRFPETIDELMTRCQNRTGLLTKLETLKNKCMDGLVKRIVSVLIYSMRRQRKSLCRRKPNKKMLEFVSAGKCINSGRLEAEKCIDQAMDHIVGTKYEDNKMKIPFVCCTFVKFKNCLIATGHKNKQCTEEHINLLVRRSEQVSNGPMNMACGDYNEETDRCEKLKLPKRKKGEKLPKSFLMPLVDLFESFDKE